MDLQFPRHFGTAGSFIGYTGRRHDQKVIPECLWQEEVSCRLSKVIPHAPRPLGAAIVPPIGPPIGTPIGLPRPLGPPIRPPIGPPIGPFLSALPSAPRPNVT